MVAHLLFECCCELAPSLIASSGEFVLFVLIYFPHGEFFVSSTVCVEDTPFSYLRSVHNF